MSRPTTKQLDILIDDLLDLAAREAIDNRDLGAAWGFFFSAFKLVLMVHGNAAVDGPAWSWVEWSGAAMKVRDKVTAEVQP